MNLSFLVGIKKFYSPLIIGTFLSTFVTASPETSSVYVKTRLDITLEHLSLQLDIPADYLADLNDCDINRKFSNNEWVAIPAKSIFTIRFIAALHDSEIRRTQPNRSIFDKTQLPPSERPQPQLEPPAPLIFDKSLQELVREGTITIKDSRQF